MLLLQPRATIATTLMPGGAGGCGSVMQSSSYSPRCAEVASEGRVHMRKRRGRHRATAERAVEETPVAGAGAQAATWHDPGPGNSTSSEEGGTSTEASTSSPLAGPDAATCPGDGPLPVAQLASSHTLQDTGVLAGDAESFASVPQSDTATSAPPVVESAAGSAHAEAQSATKAGVSGRGGFDEPGVQSERGEGGVEGGEAEESEFYEPTVGDVVVAVVEQASERWLELHLPEARGGEGDKAEEPLEPEQGQELQQEEQAQVRAQKHEQEGQEGQEGEEGKGRGQGQREAALNPASWRFNPPPPRAMNLVDLDLGEDPADTRLADGSSVYEQPMAEVGDVIMARMIGWTLAGRPLLSSWSCGVDIAWQRAAQLKAGGLEVEVRIDRATGSGFLCRLEGLRGFLPFSELYEKEVIRAPRGLQDLVHTNMRVTVIEVDPTIGKLLVSEKAARISARKRLLRAGHVVNATVERIEHYGAHLVVDGTPFRGLLHLTTISRRHVPSVGEMFSVGERIRALVLSTDHDRVAFSTQELESEAGLMLHNKQDVYNEADEMARFYRRAKGLETEEEEEEEEKGEEAASLELPLSPPVANLRYMRFEEGADDEWADLSVLRPADVSP
eukprot:jgi/Mesen1/2347/ME000156S01493